MSGATSVSVVLDADLYTGMGPRMPKGSTVMLPAALAQELIRLGQASAPPPPPAQAENEHHE